MNSPRRPRLSAQFHLSGYRVNQELGYSWGTDGLITLRANSPCRQLLGIYEGE